MSLVDTKPQTSPGEDEIYAVLDEDGRLLPGKTASIPNSDLLKIYRAMTLTRLFDQRMFILQRQGRVGFYMASTGEEAATVGSAYALQDSDWLFPCYREQGAYIWRNAPVQKMVDQCFGNANDLTKGRQMPVHYCFQELNIASVSSPIGTQIPQAVGAAWGAKLKGKTDVMISYFGEGATSHPDFHNGLNLAGVLKAPVLFFCRNNGWAISTPRSLQTASETFAIKGVAYGIEGVRVDGNDIFAVVEITRKAAEKARNGGGPTLIEAVTYRLGSHSTSDDPSAYRPEGDAESWNLKDPLRRLRLYLEGQGVWDAAKDEALHAEIKAEIDAAIQAGEATPAPAPDTIFDDVYADIPPHLLAQREELRAFLSQEAR